ncbi:MAG: S-adenosylmethionine:tRNA ribosyltransferase-isomerase [Planctomycetales bacterium]|nr:S-adenosylmethionine:tRNA ribosyltransferase-isomerase [Planctomycetales bacterium]
MTAATGPRDDLASVRLLHVDPERASFEDRRFGDLPALLRPGDLLVANDAATLPASLAGATESGAPIEARLAGESPDGTWRAVLFGAGDWRQRTEDRPAPPAVGVGERLRFDGLEAVVVEADAREPRLVRLRFECDPGAALWQALYGAGRPVQYSYLRRTLRLWHVQTPYAARPWAVEPPSAGLALTWDLLLALRRRGVAVATVTHAAGLSSIGDASADRRLPLAERYEVGEAAVAAVEAAGGRGGRVVAIGTTVTRALEAAARAGGGRLRPSTGLTDLRLGPDSPRRVVDAILTGIHEPGTSHFALLEAFAPRALLESAHAFAAGRGYLGHEFGDAVLILAAEEAAVASR